MSKKNPPKLKIKDVKGRIKILKVMGYKGSRVYVRQIDEEIFLYDLIFHNEIYSSYIVIKPKKGSKKLTKKEVNAALHIIWAGAESTIDHLLGVKLNRKTRRRVEALIN